MTTDSKHFETLGLHGGAYRADPASGAVAVPIYQTTSYQFQDTGPRLAPVRARRARQHLHPRPEPDLGCARDAHRRARRRRRGAGRRLGPDGLRLFGAQSRAGGRQHRLLDRSLRRHVDAVLTDAEAVRHRGPLRRSERSGERSAARRTPGPAPTTPRSFPIRSSTSSRSRKSPTSGVRSACR